MIPLRPRPRWTRVARSRPRARPTGGRPPGLTSDGPNGPTAGRGEADRPGSRRDVGCLAAREKRCVRLSRYLTSKQEAESRHRDRDADLANEARRNREGSISTRHFRSSQPTSR
jgi:hypothetical protein